MDRWRMHPGQCKHSPPVPARIVLKLFEAFAARHEGPDHTRGWRNSIPAIMRWVQTLSGGVGLNPQASDESGSNSPIVANQGNMN